MNQFFALIFEIIYNSQMTSDLYDYNLYGFSGIFMVIYSALSCVIFYFLFDKARYVGFLPWFVALLVSTILTFATTFFYTRSTLSQEGLEYPAPEYIYFGCFVALYGVILFFILSLILKRFRTNLAHSPF